MPRCVDLAIQALTAEGVAPAEARRASTVAFWLATGRMPGAGDEPELDLVPRARDLAAVALADEPDGAVRLEAGGGLEDLAQFAEGDAPAAVEGSPRLLREALLLRVGTFNGHSFTKADLEQLAANHDPADPPPIQLDHSLSARDTQGHVPAVRVVEDRLFGLLEFRGQEAVQRVQDRLWRKLSCGVYLRPQKRLKEVSVTPFPAVGGADPARVLHEEETPMFNCTKCAHPFEKVDLADGKAKCPKCGHMFAPDEKSDDEKKMSEDAPNETPAAPPQEKPTVDLAELAKTNPQAAAILKAHDEKIAALQAQLAKQAQEARLTEDTNKVERLVEAGRLAPAQSKAVLQFISGLSTEQRDAYLALKEAEAPTVTFGRRSVPEVARPGGPSEDEEFAGLMEAGGFKKSEKGEWVKV